MSAEKTEEQKLRSKRVHASVMMVLGAIMAACALAAGLIALRPGAFPTWMTGAWRSRSEESFRTPRKVRVEFEPWGPVVLVRAKARDKLVLLHLTTSWSTAGRRVEEETYGDPETAGWIAKTFVAARADPEEHPELASRWGVGAWPATLLIAADDRVLAAAAGLPPALLRPWAEQIAAHREKADVLAADAERRFAAVRALPPPDPAAFVLDPVWGGVHHGPGEFAKVLADQAAVVASTDAARAKAVLAYCDAFLALPDGGWAASAAGEVATSDGRIAQGAYYFSRDDARRRALGLPSVDARFLPGPNRAMARAVLASPVATPAQKARARAALRRAAKS